MKIQASIRGHAFDKSFDYPVCPVYENNDKIMIIFQIFCQDWHTKH
jgi:hypothetical protein